MSKFHLGYIDSMRGLAVLMVLSTHATMFLGTAGLPLDLENLLYSGKYGVLLFFIVSAYTLFRSMDYRKEKGLGKYFLRRFFRIAPLYYIILITLFFAWGGVDYYMREAAGITGANLFSHMLFVNGLFPEHFNSIIGVEWTIFVEVFFYLMLPWIFLYREHLTKVFIFFVGLSLGTVLVDSFYVADSLISIQLRFSPLTWLFIFAAGSLIYERRESKALKEIFSRHRFLTLGVTLTLFVAASYLSLPFEHFLFAGFAVCVFLLTQFNKWVFFDNLLLRGIGKISYSLYLTHYPIFRYFSSGEFDASQALASALALTLLISAGTYCLIEKPFINLGKKINA